VPIVAATRSHTENTRRHMIFISASPNAAAIEHGL
jgi:hypothetical protein